VVLDQIQARVLAGKAVDKARDKIERSAGDITAVMKEEKIEKEMRQAEMHVQKVPRSLSLSL